MIAALSECKGQLTLSRSREADIVVNEKQYLVTIAVIKTDTLLFVR